MLQSVLVTIWHAVEDETEPIAHKLARHSCPQLAQTGKTQNTWVSLDLSQFGKTRKYGHEQNEIHFFPSKTCIVDQFWHFCSHLQSKVLTFCQNLLTSYYFLPKKLNFHFLNPLFSGIALNSIGVGPPTKNLDQHLNTGGSRLIRTNKTR